MVNGTNGLFLPPSLGAPQEELPEECCGKCRYAKFVKATPTQINFAVRECHINPPEYQAFLVPGPDDSPAVIKHAGWPQISTAEWCNCFKPANSVQDSSTRTLDGKLVGASD